MTEEEILRIPHDATGNIVVAEQIDFIELCMDLSEVKTGVREGDDLVLVLESGEFIRLVGYFAQVDGLPPINFEDCGALAIGNIGLISGLGLLALLAGGSDAAPLEELPPVTLAYQLVNDDGTLTVGGVAAPNATVTVTFPNGEKVVVTADSNGNYEATSTTPQPSGEVTASQVAPDGRTSAPAEDILEPSPPTIVAGEGNDDGTLTVTGVAEPGATVTVTMPSGETVVVKADRNGNYEATSSGPEPDGEVTATQVTAAGRGPTAAAKDTYTDTTL
ncbi:hypothetical protein AN189_07160, partial [Loktanella sp. 3ANDIMAR09]